MKRLVGFALIGLAVGIPGYAATIGVSGTSNIFYAGQGSTPGATQGITPALVSLSGGSSVTFSSVTGTVDFCDQNIDPVCAVSTPDGISDLYSLGGTNLALAGSGLSGIQFSGRLMFLVGVFLDASTPSGAGPGLLQSYTAGSSDATSFSPGLGQLFFIGDGQSTGGGVAQTFFIPVGATRLFLGFADGAPGFTGTVGAYDDNGGSFTANFAENGAVPEPGTLALFGLGLVGLGLLRKRS